MQFNRTWRFASLGNNDDGLKEEIIDRLTKCVLDLYQTKRQSNINTLRQLRWHLFSKFQYGSEKLPLTSSTHSFWNISKSSCVQHLEKAIVSSSIVSKSWRIWLGIWYQQQLLSSSYDRSTACSKTYCGIMYFANVRKDMNL